MPNPIVLALLLVLSGCSTPQLRYQDAQLKDLSLEDSTWLIRFEAQNSNLIGAKIDALSYEGFVDGQSVAQGTLAQEVLLPGSSASQVELPLRFKHSGMLLMLKSVQQVAEIPYRLTGTATINGFTVPFDHSGVYRIPPEVLERYQKAKDSVSDRLKGLQNLLGR